MLIIYRFEQGAARVVACHFSVMAGDVGSLFNAGPKVVAGGWFLHSLPWLIFPVTTSIHLNLFLVGNIKRFE